MPSKKTYIILCAIVLIFGLVMFLLFGVKNIQQGNLETVLVVGDNTTWTYQNRKWNYVRYNESINKYNWTEFQVFEDNQELGEFYLWHDDKWYVFNENKEAVNVQGKLLAFSGNYKIKVLDFKEESVDDYTYVYSVLQDIGLGADSKFSSIYKVSLDYDGDSIEEDFYIISNALPLDFEPDITFSIAFMVKDDTIYYLYDDVSSNRGLDGCKPFYHSFIDTNIDGVYEVVVSCGKYSSTEQVDMLFQFVDGEFKLLISNQ